MSTGTSSAVKENLAPGVVRHAILVKKIARDQFAQIAKDLGVNQGDLMAACVALLGSDHTKNWVKEWFAKNPSSPMMTSPGSAFKKAIEKVDPEKLAAFLKSQNAL